MGLLLGAPASASINPGDVAITTEVTGDVTVKRDGPDGPVGPFEKVRDGDRVVLADGARVEMRSFLDGAVSSAVGPATLVVGPAGVEARRGTLASEPGSIDIASILANIPVLVARARATGTDVMRGDQDRLVEMSDDERAALDDARQTYAAMKATAAPESVLPDMFLASVLLQYDLFDEGIQVLEGALGRCAACSAAQDLLAYARSRQPAA